MFTFAVGLKPTLEKLTAFFFLFFTSGIQKKKSTYQIFGVDWFLPTLHPIAVNVY